MSRPPKYDRDEILDSALDLVREGGTRALTMTALADVTGAPSGSLYHRFPSRDVLLAELWLRSVERFQREFVARFEHGTVRESALAAADYLLAWVSGNPDEARLLLLYRREDFQADDWPAEQRRRAGHLAAEFDAAVAAFAARLGGRDASARAWFVLVDLPSAGVRRHLATGRPVPAAARRLLHTTIDALLAG